MRVFGPGVGNLTTTKLKILKGVGRGGGGGGGGGEGGCASFELIGTLWPDCQSAFNTL